MKASDLLYGERKRGVGPKKVNDVTDLFFRYCLTWSAQKRMNAAGTILAEQQGTIYRELYRRAMRDDKFDELSDQLKAIGYDKANYEEIRPICPRRTRDGDRWVIDLLATYTKPFCRARIDQVIERDGRLLGSARFYEQGYLGEPDSYRLDQLRDFDANNEGDCYLGLVDFIDEAAAATLRDIYKEREGNDQESK